ncbi:MAG: hypothetical protein M1822_008514 [Bathelium mastoideum]|nr:MAG: hypothetical protein M1822_008514 [Bathelium mastoideum]
MHIINLLAGLALSAASLIQAHDGSYINYSTVIGYFLQDDPATNATTFDYTTTNFGLINRTYPSDSSNTASLTQWQRFARQVSHLNRASPHNINYRVLFFGRHGEGYHNAAQTFYGTPAWNCYWAEVDGNGTAIWSDAHLDAAGTAQAQTAHAFWTHEFSVQHIPAPEKYYVSPLWRCLQTANVTFAGLRLPRGAAPFVPTIKHGLREGISIHTCDRRSTRAEIHAAFPDWPFERGFPETDQLWNGVTAETAGAQAVRSRAVLDDIFTADESTWISVTSHSGEIASILGVLGHQAFSLNTGAVIPVLVKAETVKGTTTTSALGWTVSPHCTAPPVTSINNGACVCQRGKAPVTTTLAGSGPTEEARVEVRK